MKLEDFVNAESFSVLMFQGFYFFAIIVLKILVQPIQFLVYFFELTVVDVADEGAFVYWNARFF